MTNFFKNQVARVKRISQDPLRILEFIATRKYMQKILAKRLQSLATKTPVSENYPYEIYDHNYLSNLPKGLSINNLTYYVDVEQYLRNQLNY